MHALIIGATGATGKDLLHILLQDESFNRVDIFVRRPIDLQHEKLHVHVIDFDQVSTWQSLVQGDVLFCCLGTTLKVAGSKEAQWKIDYDYQLAFAAAAKANNVASLVLVSSSLASADSPFFYTKMKGQLEDSIKALDFPHLHVFNPPTLIRKDSDRKAEVFFVKAIQFLNKLGVMKGQKPIPTSVLAMALVQAAKDTSARHLIYEGEEIWERTLNY